MFFLLFVLQLFTVTKCKVWKERVPSETSFGISDPNTQLVSMETLQISFDMHFYFFQTDIFNGPSDLLQKQVRKKWKGGAPQRVPGSAFLYKSV